MSRQRKIEIITTAKNGRLIENRDMIEQAVRAFDGKQVKLTIGLCHRQRSTRQNAYYFGVVVEHWRNIVRQEWGEIWSKEEVHHFLKSNLNFDELVDEETGLLLRKPRSTTENSTYKQEEYHKACRDLAWSMFNWTIPLPNEDVNAEF